MQGHAGEAPLFRGGLKQLHSLPPMALASEFRCDVEIVKIGRVFVPGEPKKTDPASPRREMQGEQPLLRRGQPYGELGRQFVLGFLQGFRLSPRATNDFFLSVFRHDDESPILVILLGHGLNC